MYGAKSSFAKPSECNDLAITTQTASARNDSAFCHCEERRDVAIAKLVKYDSKRKKAAFTLAEVLITLAIIGIVAALTIPTLLTKYEKIATQTKIRSDYSIFANALKMAEYEYGQIESWNFSDGKDYFRRLAEFIKFDINPCYEGRDCLPEDYKGAYYSDSVYFRLKNGTYGLYIDSSNTTSPKNLKHMIYFITNDKKAIVGRTYFRYSLMNFKNLNIQSNVTCGSTICYWHDLPSCANSDAAWNDYECSMKFAFDGFRFKDDYKFEDLNTPQHGALNPMLEEKQVRGWTIN